MRGHQGLAWLFDNTGQRAGGRAARGRGALARLGGDRRGAAAIIVAASAASVLGVTGLVLDVGNWYLLRRNMQAAADAASLAGAVSFDNTKSASAAEAVARSVVSRNGFVHGSNGTTVSVVTDAGTGRIEVAVERPSTGLLLRSVGFSGSTKTVRASAAGRVVVGGITPCVHALAGSVAVGNNTDITASGCALVSDSAAADALKVGSGGSVANGSGRITAANIVTHGGCEGCVQAQESGKLNLTVSRTPATYATKTGNPYANLQSWSPSSEAANCQNMPNGSSLLLSPGCYNAMRVGSNDVVDLRPGVYYIRGGNLDVQGTLTCLTCTRDNGVSIVLFGNGNSAPGVVDINAQATIRLNASTQTAQPLLDGVLIYRHAPNAQPSQNGKGEIDINGGANVRLDGAIVAPTSWMTMSGGGSTDPTSCNLFLVHSVEFRGNSEMGVQGCKSLGVKDSLPRMPRIVG